jgi:hypothetical protein
MPERHKISQLHYTREISLLNKEESTVLKKGSQEISRRHFLKSAGFFALTAGAGLGITFPSTARAGKKKLKMFQWAHTDPDFNQWFQSYCRDWGARNNIQVDMEQAAE